VATRADVARRAGVAPSTVSYALHGGRSISDETRERIRQAMVDLGYEPNEMAAALARRKSHILALLFPSTTRGFTEADLDYVVAATDAARERGYRVILWTTDAHDLGDVDAMCRGGLVDGVLLMEVLLDDARVRMLQRAGIPYALIGRTADPAPGPHADTDFDATARLAIAHLAGLGHTSLALVTLPDAGLTAGFGATVRTLDAFQTAARDGDLSLTPIPCEPTVEAGRAVLDYLRDQRPAVTGVISFIDEAVFGLYQRARELGVAIPRDLSVLSINTSHQRAPFFDPALTTIHPAAAQIGRTAARALIHTLQGTATDDEPTLWPGQLITRASTGPAPTTTREQPTA
jgi:DNA-binding LacI/PurR family transcriptional regulator